MSWLGLDANQERNLLERATAAPQEFALAAPGAFDGAAEAPFRGLARGAVVEPAKAVNILLSAFPRAIDEVRGGTEAQDWWFDRMVKPLVRYSEDLKPDPITTGAAGRVVQSIFEVVPQAVAVGPVGAGALQGFGKATELMERGVDARTAANAGAIEGVSVGVGVRLPMSIGLGTLRNALYGAGSAVLPGVAARGLTHEVLARAGYKDMAEQYRAFDLEQMAIDTILGVAFGGLGSHIESRALANAREVLRSADLEAALAANNARHLEIDAAPGLPKDLASREAHVAAVTKAAEDLMSGRPVEVHEQLGEGAEFVPDPARARREVSLEPLAREFQTIEENARQAELELPAAEGVAPGRTVQIQAALRNAGEEVTAQNVATVELIRRAREVDAEAVDRLPENLPDAEYLARVHEIAERHPEAAPAAAEVDRAAQVVAARPDMQVVLPDGTTTTAREAMERAEAIIEQARRESAAIEAAVECFIEG